MMNLTDEILSGIDPLSGAHPQTQVNSPRLKTSIQQQSVTMTSDL